MIVNPIGWLLFDMGLQLYFRQFGAIQQHFVQVSDEFLNNLIACRPWETAKSLELASDFPNYLLLLSFSHKIIVAKHHSEPWDNQDFKEINICLKIAFDSD